MEHKYKLRPLNWMISNRNIQPLFYFVIFAHLIFKLMCITLGASYSLYNHSASLHWKIKKADILLDKQGQQNTFCRDRIS